MRVIHQKQNKKPVYSIHITPSHHIAKGVHLFGYSFDIPVITYSVCINGVYVQGFSSLMDLQDYIDSLRVIIPKSYELVVTYGEELPF